MLDAVHSRGDALLHRRERVCVRGDGESEPVGLLDDGPDLLQGELAGAGCRWWTSSPAVMVNIAPFSCGVDDAVLGGRVAALAPWRATRSR